MTNLELGLNQLKATVLEMMVLARLQLEKAKIAFLENNVEIAEEVIHSEKRLNAYELSIDREIENVLALYQPVASDLRFAISMLKINSNIERIGDYADGIADYIVDLKEPIPKFVMDESRVSDMFDIAISMLTDIHTAFEKGDTKLARRVYKKDVELNSFNKNASSIISKLIDDKKATTRAMLFLFSTIRKIERAGDHIKNIAEDIIFHHEAEVIKHKKMK
jgi:phosphate transport system protein